MMVSMFAGLALYCASEQVFRQLEPWKRLASAPLSSHQAKSLSF